MLGGGIQHPRVSIRSRERCLTPEDRRDTALARPIAEWEAEVGLSHVKINVYHRAGIMILHFTYQGVRVSSMKSIHQPC